jgi:hypothetical protein
VSECIRAQSNSSVTVSVKSECHLIFEHFFFLFDSCSIFISAFREGRITQDSEAKSKNRDRGDVGEIQHMMWLCSSLCRGHGFMDVMSSLRAQCVCVIIGMFGGFRLRVHEACTCCQCYINNLYCGLDRSSGFNSHQIFDSRRTL